MRNRSLFFFLHFYLYVHYVKIIRRLRRLLKGTVQSKMKMESFCPLPHVHGKSGEVLYSLKLHSKTAAAVSSTTEEDGDLF